MHLGGRGNSQSSCAPRERLKSWPPSAVLFLVNQRGGRESKTLNSDRPFIGFHSVLKNSSSNISQGIIIIQGYGSQDGPQLSARGYCVRWASGNRVRGLPFPLRTEGAGCVDGVHFDVSCAVCVLCSPSFSEGPEFTVLGVPLALVVYLAKAPCGTFILENEPPGEKHVILPC